MNLQQRELLRIYTGFPFKRFPEEKHTNEPDEGKTFLMLCPSFYPELLRKCCSTKRLGSAVLARSTLLAHVSDA